MPLPFLLAPLITAVTSGIAAAGTAAAAVGSTAAAVGSTVAAGAAVVGTAAAATAAALGTTGMVVGGVALAGAVLVVLTCITVEEIRNQARQRAAELNRHIIKAKILKCVEEGNYNQVHVGLYDSSDVLRGEIAARAKEQDWDVYEGKVIALAS